MKYDKPLVAFVVGALSTIPYQVFTLVLIAVGFGKYNTYELSSLIITLNRPTAALGVMTSSLVGGITALSLYYALKKLGWDYLIYKSLTAGLLSWLITEAMFVWLIEGPRLIEPRPLNDYFLHLFGAFIFGISLGLFFKIYFLKKFPIS